MGSSKSRASGRRLAITMDPLPGNVPSAPAQQPIVVIVQAPAAGSTTSDADHFKKFFPKRAVIAMSLTMIVAGVLSVILQISLIAMPTERYYNYFAHIGQGIWCGVFYIVAGGLGVSAAQKPNNCSIISLMVFSILAACMAVPHMTLDGIGAGEGRRWSSSRHQGLKTGLYSFLFLLGLGGGITSIVLSSYTCRAVCCRRSKNSGTVVYNPTGGAIPAQAIQLGNMDLAKVIATQQQAAAVQQQPPAYNTVAQMYNPAQQTDLERGALANESTGEGEDTESLTGGDNYKGFF